MSEQKLHMWRDTKARGDAGEKAIAEYFSQWYVVTKAVCMSEQKRGIDFTFASRRTAERLEIEVKTDARSESTGNFFVELEQNTSTHAPGWALTCTADSILFYQPNVGRCFIVPVVTLKERLPAWCAVHKKKTARGQFGYSKGVCVPVNEVRAIALHEVAIT